MAEFALAIPVLVLLIFGLIEVGFMINTRMVLQDAVRQAAHYGSNAGRTDGATGSLAPGCLADYSVLDDIKARLQGTSVDGSHVRSIFIYAGDAANGSDSPRLTPLAGTGLTMGTAAAYPRTYPLQTPGYLNGDYYYANYDPSTGKDVDGGGNGSGRGAVYKLFNDDEAHIFAGTLVAGYPSSPPSCGSTLNATDGSGSSCLPFNETGGTVNSACIGNDTLGDWPPLWRNNLTEKSPTTNWPDSFGVDITYDYQFHTPLFQVFANLFLGNSHVIRMDDKAVFLMSPPV